MEIKNLSQLKKAIAAGNIFIIKDHRVSEFIGKKRKGNVIQTNGIYSIVPDEPENRINQANGRKGSWLEYGKASEWKFDNGICTLYNGEHKPENLVMSFVFE
ncbi:peptidylprolyl isomerase [Konateibacter massiliensis]|uniref:peptidylprolyl isomerase n=1 Tax=Konateibacter massiliensis TaxID=2002841 RepID=UPI000C14BE46|nr:peptidylprolyl isomerase [Konateibacter massiliensis]